MLDYKSVLEGFWNGELHDELLDRKKTRVYAQTKEVDQEGIMTIIDKLRRCEVYVHRPVDCTDKCKKRGLL